ncbi:LysE family translocator [Candidatus Chloroploca sp. Khr17]|uniref:LysE family translocator n=1 Tax=Candidatus Chloroploca sp. Khr17 TaxID=2496869 RepID=UPI00101C11BC|nr:LysE family translocator [Candidatus Chloroploca sp. Khr17]
MLIDIQTLVAFIPIVLVLVLIPGPDMVFITANALSSGKRGGVFSALGCTTGAFTHAVLAAFGLTAIVVAWQPAYEVVRIGGALYLLYLGVKLLFAKESPLSVSDAGVGKSGIRLFREGLINNLMNPKAILFSLTFLPQFADPIRGPIWAQIIILGIVLAVIMLAIEIPIAVTSGHFGQWLTSRSQAASLLSKAMGAVLIGLAVWVFQSRRIAH